MIGQRLGYSQGVVGDNLSFVRCACKGSFPCTANTTSPKQSADRSSPPPYESGYTSHSLGSTSVQLSHVCLQIQECVKLEGKAGKRKMNLRATFPHVVVVSKIDVEHKLSFKRFEIRVLFVFFRLKYCVIIIWRASDQCDEGW